MEQAFSYSDIYQLGAIAWRFPEKSFSDGLTDGSFSTDLVSCLKEIGISSELADSAGNDLMAAVIKDCNGDPDVLFEKLRTDFTVLFLVPKKEKVYIYESLFRYPAEASKKDYTMFISPCALHAEQLYRQAGVTLKNNVREPADHFATELEFLSYLYKMAAAEADSDIWATRISDFKKTHLKKWYIDFLKAVTDSAQSETYRTLASIYMILDK